MANILLTGGTGFIGSHTAVELLNTGENVILVDNLANSDKDVIERIEKITGKKVRFYQADAADGTSMLRIFSENQVDAVIHFAGFKAVGESVHKPLMYYRNNIDTMLTLLEVMQEKNVKRIIFSSSATVYGKNAKVPFTESMPTGECTSPYGWTKHILERILQDVSTADPEMSVVSLRYFNPIGAHKSGVLGEKPNGIPNNLMPYITQVADGVLSELSVFGDDYQTPDGTGVRDYVHVVDLAKGHAAALQYAMNHTGYEAINLGAGKGYSVLEVIHAFEKANGVKIPYTIAPRRAGDLDVCYADTKKAKVMLNWQTEKDIVEMCSDAWRWQQHCKDKVEL